MLFAKERRAAVLRRKRGARQLQRQTACRTADTPWQQRTDTGTRCRHLDRKRRLPLQLRRGRAGAGRAARPSTAPAAPARQPGSRKISCVPSGCDGNQGLRPACGVQAERSRLQLAVDVSERGIVTYSLKPKQCLDERQEFQTGCPAHACNTPQLCHARPWSTTRRRCYPATWLHPDVAAPTSPY